MKIAIIGGGHAGVEAALISKRNGVDTTLFTLQKNMIANMPCNPSIGGPAKGTVVREIDALGGEMGICADRNNIQVKILNSSKGPGVWALRAQADKILYPKHMIQVLDNEQVNIVEELVTELNIKDNKIKGLKTEKRSYDFDAVVVTTGTYMTSQILLGHTITEEGPDDQRTDNNLSNQLSELGFNLQRLKTGTPPRVRNSSVDWSKTEIQPGDKKHLTFSYDNVYYQEMENQEPCYLTYTNDKTHKLIEDNLKESAMYSGYERGTGPRYCPSIEDKVVRFNDKERHQLFLEPESRLLDTIYVQGLSMSFPHKIQDEIIRTIPGLENCEVLKYAYAIEYDAIDSTKLKSTLEAKEIDSLFFAGQVNGTSGYEEAAGQGILAGINAVQKVKGMDPFILDRGNSYIGVMVDDLITKGTNEPYRLLTSRAENRIMIRDDNADMRLSKKAYDAGILPKKRWDIISDYINQVENNINLIKEMKFTSASPEIKEMEIKLNHGISGFDLIKRPDVDIDKVLPSTDSYIKKRVNIEVKLSGYIEKARRVINKLNKVENLKLPKVDFNEIKNLSLEAREKLNKVKPETLGQASRISGVNPSDINVILIWMKQKGN